MTMSLSAPLQRALFERLSTAPELAMLAGRVFDEAPHGQAASSSELYVTLGDEVVSAWNTATEVGATHTATIRIHAARRGFVTLKELAAQVTEAISANPPTPDGGEIITHEFIEARTVREEDAAVRRIDLTFRFVIEAEPVL